jgi:DHA1 family inner membrane transport protein
MTDKGRVWMLIAMSAATFVVTASGSATAPFMPAIAADLATDIPAIAHLFSVQAMTWGASALLFGMFSHRLNRRVTLVVSVVAMGVIRVLFALSPDYTAAFAWQFLSGICGGAFMGVVFATVSDHIPAGTRGRALSWVITGQSLSLVIGVPIVTLLGMLGGWRYALGIHGAFTASLAIALRLATPRDVVHPAHAQPKRAPLSSLLQFHLLALMGAGTTERVCFATLAIFLPTFLQRAYAVPLSRLALALALVALGNLVGNVIGGRIADRTRSRRKVFAVTLSMAAVLALPTLLWHPGLAVSVGLGFVYSFVNAAGRPSLMAVLSDMPSELRGALFGLNITMASMGWLLAGSAGAALLATGGFTALGIFCSMMAAAGAALALTSSAPGKIPAQAIEQRQRASRGKTL